MIWQTVQLAACFGTNRTSQCLERHDSHSTHVNTLCNVFAKRLTQILFPFRLYRTGDHNTYSHKKTVLRGTARHNCLAIYIFKLFRNTFIHNDCWCFTPTPSSSVQVFSMFESKAVTHACAGTHAGEDSSTRGTVQG